MYYIRITNNTYKDIVFSYAHGWGNGIDKHLVCVVINPCYGQWGEIILKVVFSILNIDFIFV